MKEAYKPESVKDGVFGAMMNVQLINDGPVTFDFDTAKSGAVSAQKAKDEKKKQWAEKKVMGMKKQVGDGGNKKKTGKGREGSSGLHSEQAETEMEATSTTDDSANAVAPSVPSKQEA